MGYRKDSKVLLNYKNELEKIKANGKTAYNTKRIDKIWEKLIYMSIQNEITNELTMEECLERHFIKEKISEISMCIYEINA